MVTLAVQASMTDDRILHEAEQWFRRKLRGETTLAEFEEPFFVALAQRRASQPDAYIARSITPLSWPSDLAVERLPTTRPPPADLQAELLKVSRGEAREAETIVPASEEIEFDLNEQSL